MGRGRAKGLAAPEATWLMGQGLQGLDLAGPATVSPPSGREGAQVCQSEGRWELGQVWSEGRGFGQTRQAGRARED